MTIAHSLSLSVGFDEATQKRAISVLNIFRFALSGLFLVGFFYLRKNQWLEVEHQFFYVQVAFTYFFVSLLFLFFRPKTIFGLNRLLPIQIVSDLIFVILLMYTAGGVSSGLGFLLIVLIVSASLVSNGRYALFYASVTSVSLLVEESYEIFRLDLPATTYTQTVMLCLGCYATAWLAHSLAKRMQASEALASAREIDVVNLEQINALITKEMHDGVLVVDAHNNIRLFNPPAQTLLDLPDIQAAVPLPQGAQEIDARLKQWATDPSASNKAQVKIHNRDLNLRFVQTGESRARGAIVIMQDLSQMQSAAQQAKLAALGRLTANIAHEIRNPLSAISHANQLLQEEEGISADTVRILQIVADNIQRIDKIVKDVLELNRRDRTQQEKIEINPFVVAFYQQFCAVENIAPEQFTYTLCAQPFYVDFDHRHLTQILWNLSRNAWEHGQKTKRSVQLNCVMVSKTSMNIEIVDDGAGVEEKNRARLFEPFFTTKTTGNGLGLYISRELAEANGANLVYEMKPTGSTFIIQFKRQSLT